MEYTITSKKTISIVNDGVDSDGSILWHAEENESGDKTEVTVQNSSGETIKIYVDSIVESEVESDVEELMSAQ